MNLSSFFSTLIFGGLKNTYPSKNIPTMSRKELKDREKAAQMFLEIMQKSKQDPVNFSEEDRENLRFITQQLGPQHSIQGTTVHELENKIFGGAPFIGGAPLKGYFIHKKADTTQNQNQRTRFEAIAKSNAPVELFNKLSQLLNQDLSDTEKQSTFYFEFQQDPSLMLVCLSHPTQYSNHQRSENPQVYQPMEYILKDPSSWETIVRLALSHYTTIGLFNVETILLSIIQKFLDKPHLKKQAHPTSIATLMQVEEGEGDTPQGRVSMKQCPRIISALLAQKALISDTLLEECASYHIPTLALDQINMTRRLSCTSSDKTIQDQQAEKNRANWRENCINTLSKVSSERSHLIKKQNALLEKHPWLLNNAIEKPQLTLKDTLSLLKEIIEISGHWTMPHNHLWAQANIAHIDKICVRLLLNVCKKEMIIPDSFSDENFVHSAARLGGEAARIIQAIHDEPLLAPLLQQCCGCISNENAPLKIAIKSNNNRQIIEILIAHTIIQDKHKANNYTQLLASDRRLNDEYRQKESEIRDLIYLSTDFENKPKNLFNLLKTEDTLLKDILFDHLEYLEYIMSLTHTNLASANSPFPLLECNTLSAFFKEVQHDDRKRTAIERHLSCTYN